MKNEFRRQLKTALLIVLFLFMIGFVASFFYIKLTHKDVSPSKDSISIHFNYSDTIKVDSSLPISDTLGKTITVDQREEKTVGYIEIVLTNKSDNDATYQLLLSKEVVEAKELNEHYVKLYLTDSSDKPIEGFDKNAAVTYNELRYFNKKPSNKLLYEGILAPKEEKLFKLRTWVSDSYSISNVFEEFQFSVGLN